MTELGIYCLSSAWSLGSSEWALRPAGDDTDRSP